MNANLPFIGMLYSDIHQGFNASDTAQTGDIENLMGSCSTTVSYTKSLAIDLSVLLSFDTNAR